MKLTKTIIGGTMISLQTTLNRYSNLGRYSKYLLLVLALSIFALGAKLANTNASTQKKSFRIAEAITKSADGKTITAKPGFELVKKGNGIAARRHGQATMLSSDTVSCFCQEFAPCKPGGPTPCCNHGKTEVIGGPTRSCKETDNTAGQATCSGNCDRCKWQ